MTHDQAMRLMVRMYDHDSLNQTLGTWEKRIQDPLGTYLSEAELSDADEADGIDPTWGTREREALRLFAGLTPAERRTLLAPARQASKRHE